MSKLLIALCFAFLSLSLVQCQNPIDKINGDKKTYNYLTQSNLQTQSNSNSNIYKCSSISEYFQTVGQSESLSLSYSVLKHNYLYISFEYAFINVLGMSGGVTKQGQVDLNGNTLSFSTKVYSDDYNCMTRTDNTKVDGKSQATFVLAHSGSVDLKFYSDNIASFARFGVSNLTITAYYCGVNAELSSKTLTCVCKSGYKETIVQYSNLKFKECQ
ncbi:hypothetical protein ABPG74_006322 [Tetrahymena malaccensis]